MQFQYVEFVGGLVLLGVAIVRMILDSLRESNRPESRATWKLNEGAAIAYEFHC